MNKPTNSQLISFDTSVSATNMLDTTFQPSIRVLLDTTFQPSARNQFSIINQTMNQESYELFPSSKYKEDLVYWQKNNRKIYRKICKLVIDTQLNPFEGIGSPKYLNRKDLGYKAWSRKITEEHRLLYRVDGSRIDLIQARYHYKK